MKALGELALDLHRESAVNARTAAREIGAAPLGVDKQSEMVTALRAPA